MKNFLKRYFCCCDNDADAETKIDSYHSYTGCEQVNPSTTNNVHKRNEAPLVQSGATTDGVADSEQPQPFNDSNRFDSKMIPPDQRTAEFPSVSIQSIKSANPINGPPNKKKFTDQLLVTIANMPPDENEAEFPSVQMMSVNSSSKGNSNNACFNEPLPLDSSMIPNDQGIAEFPSVPIESINSDSKSRIKTSVLNYPQ